ncbi:unnamed protein product [Spirodela intermedia]|uniref:Uncharacterized protein n=1 Tax=Spirodela intermedia TaxID=51605 RepID=A0A7I8IYQ2_SPIIN|nr:unnamed protein product [Spirodela intermedia]CAA6662273.1 unnamed protein product [Spirodela intermedia]
MKVPDRSKRDEWSEGGVVSLLEAYEAKWMLRNRAKLKWSDWEDVARQVSDRCAGTKTPTSARTRLTPSFRSSWQFYSRMDGLLKGAKAENNEASGRPLPKVVVDLEMEGNLQESNQDDGSSTLPDHVLAVKGKNEKESRGLDNELSTPRGKVAGDVGEGSRRVGNPSKRRGSGNEVAESIMMEMQRHSERMRIEAEIKRGEMELKRTEIVAKTQLQIAKILSRRTKGKNVKCENPSTHEASMREGTVNWSTF